MAEPMKDVDATAALPGWFIAVRQGVDRVTGALNVVGTGLILVLMVLVNADVIGRGLFKAPVAGVPEMVSMSIVAIVFLQVAQTFRQGRLTRTDILLGWVGRYSPRTREVVEMLFSIAAIALVWQLITASWPLFEQAWTRGTYEGTIGAFTAPVWPVKLIILVGCGALLVQLVLHGLAAFLRLVRGARA
ncbi:MAG: TRAP-type mannitol/chloroaromatic compound transport system, small permease component [Rhodobacteraceae bacterium HLUCCO07]|nr:MAG: TRAP-type mannitol/chloroaromatic compound transport system, small permease component [Rhodobacteraceae bacterium HLUCCO07]